MTSDFTIVNNPSEQTLDFSRFEREAPAFFNEYLTHLGKFLDYKEIKNVAVALLGSHQMAGQNPLPQDREFFIISIIKNQMAADQDSATLAEDETHRVQKLSRFLLGATKQRDTSVAQYLIQHRLFSSCPHKVEIMKEALRTNNATVLNALFAKEAPTTQMREELFKVGITTSMVEDLLREAHKTSTPATVAFLVDFPGVNLTVENLRLGFAIACRTGNIDLFQKLLHRADFEGCQNGFMVAFLNRRLEILTRLESQSKFLLTERLGYALETAYHKNDSEVVSILAKYRNLSEGIKTQIFKDACEKNNLKMVSALVPSVQSSVLLEQYLLLQANGNEALCKAMLESNNMKKVLVFHYCSNNDVEALQSLHGLPREAIKMPFNMSYHTSRYAILKQLLTYGVLNDKDIGKAFKYACKKNDIELFRILVNHPLLTQHYRTPGLQLASDNNSVAILDEAPHFNS